ncbi:hypothetical protein Tco_1027303 [Tanacetum coccineum]
MAVHISFAVLHAQQLSKFHAQYTTGRMFSGWLSTAAMITIGEGKYGPSKDAISQIFTIRLGQVSTPMNPVEKLKPNTGKPMDQLEYSRAIGCLIYPSVLEAYSGANWINHVEDSSSTSRWVFLLRGGAISWASKKKTCITGSTMEYEFVALADVGARTKRTTYVNMKFCRFKKLGLGFLYVH